MMKIDPHEYNISIRKIIDDDETLFEATIKELPDVTEFSDSYVEAYELAIDTIETTAKILEEKDKEMPLPSIIDNDYSGRITLRLPKSLHKNLASFAQDEGVSLNSQITNLLTYSLGAMYWASKIAETWVTVDFKTLNLRASQKSGKVTARAIVKRISVNPNRRGHTWAVKNTA